MSYEEEEDTCLESTKHVACELLAFHPQPLPRRLRLQHLLLSSLGLVI